MSNVFRLVVIALLCWPSSVIAQVGPVDQIRAEDETLGPGCNPIAFAVVTDVPIAPTQAWVDDHAACVGDSVRVLAHCLGGLMGESRLEVCALIVNRGDGVVTMDCENFQMITDLGPYAPNSIATDELTASFVDLFRQRGFDVAADHFIPCTQSPLLEDNLAVVAAFDMPRIEAPVALKVKVTNDLGGIVAFLVTVPRQEIPGP